MSRFASDARQGRPVRIGVDFHTWDGLFQGLRSHILGLYKQAIVLAPDIDFYFFLNDVESLVSEHPEFGLPNVVLVRTPRRSSILRLLLQMPWLQWKHRIDLLHMQFRLPFITMGPCAVTIHDVLYETHPQYFKPSFVRQSKITCKYAANHSKILFAVSQFTKFEIERLYKVAASRISVTYNGVDRSRFNSGSDESSVLERFNLQPREYIITVGRLEPRKNHKTLIEAYANSKLKNLPPLILIGQKDFGYDGIDDAVAKYNLGDKVRIFQNVADSELPVLLRCAKLFVYPAFAEGFGMPVLEAMASGVPVITSNTTSLPEVGGDAAIYVSPTNVSELSAAIDRVLSNDDVRARMVSSGLNRAASFDWKSSAEVLVGGFRTYFASR